MEAISFCLCLSKFTERERERERERVCEAWGAWYTYVEGVQFWFCLSSTFLGGGEEPQLPSYICENKT